ncbi:hypothetical protein [Secundilactobacillus kimchicus]|uniref:hypothetical protein n=1 Tax=Secundilactobacillus kimchicus TaxID=528209 RepID=UPI0006D1551E|nr:hypothetical protein [Secundilactobacillus kimchicus]
MKKTLKLSLLFAMTLFIGGGIITSTPPINGTKDTVQAAESMYQVKFLIDAQAGNQTPIPISDGATGTVPQIPASGLQSTTYLDLIKQADDRLMVTLQQLVAISDYVNNRTSAQTATDLYNANNPGESALTVDAFKELATRNWEGLGFDGYYLSQDSLNAQLAQLATFKTPENGEVETKLTLHLTKNSTQVTGQFSVGIAKDGAAAQTYKTGQLTTMDNTLTNATFQDLYTDYLNQNGAQADWVSGLKTMTQYLNHELALVDATNAYNQASKTNLTTDQFHKLTDEVNAQFGLQGYMVDETALAQQLGQRLGGVQINGNQVSLPQLVVPMVPIPTHPAPPVSGLTGLPEAVNGLYRGQAVYAVKAINLYSSPTFTSKTKRLHYNKQRRINRPMFVVTGFSYSSAGRLRYKVRDVNHTWKSAGKTGYITARASFVQPVYYRTLAKGKVITVVAKNGLNAYRTKSLTGKKAHFKKAPTYGWLS